MVGESVKTLSCPNCAGVVAINLPGQAVTLGCKSCGAVIDPASSKGAKIVQEGFEKMGFKPEIPFGKKGDLNGVKWMCLGLIIKKDKKWDFRWREYLLFNPKEGFRWLTEGDGNWTMVQPLKAKPQSAVDDEIFFRGHHCLQHQGRNFRIFHRGRYEVVSVLGEFYWVVRRGDTGEFEDYVRAGEMISYEKSDGEVNYSLGYYISADEVQKAFGLTEISQPHKVAPHEPTGFSEDWPKIKAMWFYFTGLTLVIFFMAVIAADSARLSAENYSLPPNFSSASPALKLADFHLASSQNIELELEAPVSNNWFELAYTLVNRQSGDSIDFDQGVEYYSGYDSDGSWTEGSQRNTKVISALPAGDYELLAQPVSSSVSNFRVAVNRDVPLYSNLIWMMILISIYPLFFLWRMHADLADKWSESDFTPFSSGEDDE